MLALVVRRRVASHYSLSHAIIISRYVDVARVLLHNAFALVFLKPLTRSFQTDEASRAIRRLRSTTRLFFCRRFDLFTGGGGGSRRSSEEVGWGSGWKPNTTMLIQLPVGPLRLSTRLGPLYVRETRLIRGGFTPHEQSSISR